MKSLILKILQNKQVSFFIHGLKKISRGFNFAINTILLSIVYIFGIGLTWILAKIMKKHFLDMRPLKDSKTYWQEAEPSSNDIRDYYRQF